MARKLFRKGNRAGTPKKRKTAKRKLPAFLRKKRK